MKNLGVTYLSILLITGALASLITKGLSLSFFKNPPGLNRLKSWTFSG